MILVSPDSTEIASAGDRLVKQLGFYRNLLNQAIVGLTTLYTINEFLLSSEVVLGMWATLKEHWKEVEMPARWGPVSLATEQCSQQLEREMAKVEPVTRSCFVTTSGGFDGLAQLEVVRSTLDSLLEILALPQRS